MSFLETIEGHLRNAPALPALVEIHRSTRKTISRGELLRAIERWRRILRSFGVTPGERVALVAPNSATWVAVDLAICTVGAIAVPLYARQDPKELAGMLADCDPRLVVVADVALAEAIGAHWPLSKATKAKKNKKNAGQLVTYADALSRDAHGLETIAGETEAPHGSRGSDAVGARAAGATATADDSRAHPVAASDWVTLIYTSGTSGEPKGVIWDRANVDYMLPTTVKSLDELARGGDAVDEVFHFLPFCFAGSRIMLWSQLYRGNPLMLSTRLENLVDEMAEAAPHYYLNVPAVLERIRRGVTQKLEERGGLALSLYRAGLEAKRRTRSDSVTMLERLTLQLAERVVFRAIRQQVGPRLRFLICGSAPLSEETQRWFETLGIPVYQVYGLTETTAIVTMDRPNEAVAGRVGHPIAGCEVALSDEGELICRGPNIFRGYFGRDEATAAVLRDGWFHSGDQAEIDERGNIRIIGRLKHLLVMESGHNVAPEPIEQRLVETCPALDQLMIVGHGRRFLALLYTGSPESAAVESALAAVNGDLPHYRKIRKAIRVDEPFSVDNGLLTANQKMRRKAIEAHFSAPIEELYR